MEQKPVQFRLVRKQQQSFRVGVKPAQRVHAGWEAEVRQRRIWGAIPCELRKNAVWFVERDQHAMAPPAGDSTSAAVTGQAKYRRLSWLLHVSTVTRGSTFSGRCCPRPGSRMDWEIATSTARPPRGAGQWRPASCQDRLDRCPRQ